MDIFFIPPNEEWIIVKLILFLSDDLFSRLPIFILELRKTKKISQAIQVDSFSSRTRIR